MFSALGPTVKFRSTFRHITSITLIYWLAPFYVLPSMNLISKQRIIESVTHWAIQKNFTVYCLYLQQSHNSQARALYITFIWCWSCPLPYSCHEIHILRANFAMETCLTSINYWIVNDLAITALHTLYNDCWYSCIQDSVNYYLIISSIPSHKWCRC